MLMYLFESLKQFDGGWISPTGDFIPCDHSNQLHHSNIAWEVLGKPDDWSDPMRLTYILLDKGWLRVVGKEYDNDPLILDMSMSDNLTSSCFNTLRDIVKRHGKDCIIEFESTSQYYTFNNPAEFYRFMHQYYRIES